MLKEAQVKLLVVAHKKGAAVTASFTSFATIITNSILFISILITLICC